MSSSSGAQRATVWCAVGGVKVAGAEDEAAVAQVEMSEAHLADPSVPVFWILPKGLITTIFPPFSSPPEAFTAGHKALNYVASAALMGVICLTT